MNIIKLLFSFFMLAQDVVFFLSCRCNHVRMGAGMHVILGYSRADNPMTIGPAITTVSWFVLTLWIILAVPSSTRLF